MAEHGEIQYATAEGNDYKEHEGTYSLFLRITVVGILYVVSVMVGLTLGGVLGYWWLLLAVILISTITAVIGVATGKDLPSIVVLVLSLLALALLA
jgi:hypothetical protein